MQESLGSASDGPVNISLREYLDILRRRRAIILQTFFVVLVVGILISIYTLDVYRSSGRLLLAPNSYSINTINTSDPLADIFQSNQQYSVLTQVEMLQSAELRKKLQENLKGKALPQITVTPVEGTQIINITAEGEDPIVVGDTPNQLMDLYIADQKDKGEARLKAALKNADTNVDKFTKKMDDIDKEIRKFKQKYQISELEKNRDELLEQSRNASQALFNAESTVRTIAGRLEATKRAMAQVGATTNTVVSIESDPELRALDTQLASLEAERLRSAKDFPEGSLPLSRIDAQLNRLREQQTKLVKNWTARNQIQNPVYLKLAGDMVSMNIEATAASLSRADIARQYQQIQGKLAQYPAWENKWAELQSDKTRTQNLLNAFLTSQTNLGLRNSAKEQKPGPISLSRSTTPTVAVRPDRVRNILFSGILGVFLGLCLALLQELFDDRINSPEEAERTLRIPNLGVIPLIEESGLRLIKDASAFSPLMESYRTLRTNINFAAVGRPVRSLVVTSAIPAEGKSTTVANLAMAMAMDQKRVIIVDADLRRPSMHKLFKVDSSPGLTNVLVGTHQLEQVIRPTPSENIFLVTAGSPPPNPAELLGSARMGQLMAELESHADIILFDSPPVTFVTDGVVLASRANGVLVVIAFGETRKTSTRKALDMLSRANANVLGTVLNRLDGPGSNYYYYGKYYAPQVADKIATVNNRVAGRDSDTESAVSGAERPSLTQGSVDEDKKDA
jgi:capsular exopolysaccharide synthesis family protein